MQDPTASVRRLHDPRRRVTTRAERRRRTLVAFHRALRAAPTPLDRAEVAERYRRLADHPVTPAA